MRESSFVPCVWGIAIGYASAAFVVWNSGFVAAAVAAAGIAIFSQLRQSRRESL